MIINAGNTICDVHLFYHRIMALEHLLDCDDETTAMLLAEVSQHHWVVYLDWELSTMPQPRLYLELMF